MTERQRVMLFTLGCLVTGSILIGLGTNAFVGAGVFVLFLAFAGIVEMG